MPKEMSRCPELVLLVNRFIQNQVRSGEQLSISEELLQFFRFEMRREYCQIMPARLQHANRITTEPFPATHECHNRVNDQYPRGRSRLLDNLKVPNRFFRPCPFGGK